MQLVYGDVQLNYCYSLQTTNETPVCTNAEVKSAGMHSVANDAFMEGNFFTRMSIY